MPKHAPIHVQICTSVRGGDSRTNLPYTIKENSNSSHLEHSSQIPIKTTTTFTIARWLCDICPSTSVGPRIHCRIFIDRCVSIGTSRSLFRTSCTCLSHNAIGQHAACATFMQDRAHDRQLRPVASGHSHGESTPYSKPSSSRDDKEHYLGLVPYSLFLFLSSTFSVLFSIVYSNTFPPPFQT